MKRGGPLKRSGFLKRGKPMKRGKAIKKRNPERCARHELRDFGDRARLARTRPCCACGAKPPSQAAHYLTRGSGQGHKEHVVPLCWRCHREQEAATERFEARHARFTEDGELRGGFVIGDVRCATLAEVASYVADMVREHLCHEWPQAFKGAARCLVCLLPIDDPEALNP